MGTTIDDDQLAQTIKFSFMMTNGLKYDFGNNFSIFRDPSNVIRTGILTPNRKYGQVYTVPVDGEYEFDLDITHNITTYNYVSAYKVDHVDNGLFGKRDWKKSGAISGYDGGVPNNNTWMYNAMEQFYAANMVMWVKDEFFDTDGGGIGAAYEAEFEYQGPLETTITQC